MKQFGLVILLLLLCKVGFAQLPPLPPRPAVEPGLAPFYHGVASGDPLADRVIIWTRVTPTVAGSISVNWQVATDTLFTHIVNSGTVTTDSNVDYTVKVDVTGLSANSWYYYRFISGGATSIAGRTKTLPVGNTDSIRLAVFSCSDFQTGYFNAYNDIANRNDVSAVVHLGDWYYEYKAGGSDASGDTSRFHPLNTDALSLGDYRLWESQYRLDKDLRGMLEQYPIIMVWDDHEIANNGWYSGAENHHPGTQGSWFARKIAAKRAYFEWNPIRLIAPGNDSIIHRNFNFGNLFNLVMLDTRFEARDSSLGTLIPTTNAYLIDTNRRMIGNTQLNWLKGQLSDGTTQWKLIGNQVMIAPLVLSVLLFTEIANGDQWDGYPAERNRVFNYISQNNIKDVVFLSGDIHSSWACDLPGADSTYVSATGAGSVATEFIGSSITSTATSPAPASTIMTADPYFKYVDFAKRGYLLFDVNKTRVQGDFIHVSGTNSRTYSTSDDAQWVNLNNERHLRVGTSMLAANPGNPPLVSQFPASVNDPVATDKGFTVLACYPNPASEMVNIQFYISEPTDLTLNITDVKGRVAYAGKTGLIATGVNNFSIRVSDLANGIYFISLGTANFHYSRAIMITK